MEEQQSIKQNKQEQQLQKHEVETEVTPDNCVDESRRKTLKKIAAGGTVAGLLAVSGRWSKPVVDSIILPAHAQATNVNVPSPTTTIVQDNATGNIIYCQCNAASVIVPPYEAAPLSSSDSSAKQQ